MHLKTLKVGIAGASRGYLFYRHLTSLDNVHVTAVMDPSAEAREAFCRNYPVAAIATYRELLDSGVDAVVLASPMPAHADQSVLALERDIHVLSEVTAAVSLEECKRLFQAAAGSKAKYMMGENFCYFRENVAVRNMARAGRFGELYFAEGEYIASPLSMREVYGMDGKPTWRKTHLLDKRGCTYATHSLGPVLQWLGEPVATVSCFGSGNRWQPPHAQDNTTLMLCRTASDALVKIRVDLLPNRPRTVFFALQGTEGCYEGPRSEGEEHKVWLRGKSGAFEQWQPLSDLYSEFLPADMLDLPEPARGTYHYGANWFMTRDFVRCVREEIPVPIDIYDALHFTIPGLLSEHSIETGGTPIHAPNLREGVWI